MTVVIDPGGGAFSPIVGVAQPTRTLVSWYTATPTALTAAQALLTLTGTRGNATVAASGTPTAVPVGKTFRVTSMNLSYFATTTGYGFVQLRANMSGAVSASSPVYKTLAAGPGVSTSSNSGTNSGVGEFMEFPGGTQWGITGIGYNAAAAAAVGYVMVDITGYEY